MTNGGNVIAGNYIGIDVTGTSALGNGIHGVVISAPSNTIGGTTAGARNVIFGNNQAGIRIVSATGNIVQGNFIGTDAAGTVVLGNGTGQDARGVYLSNASGNIIGGTGAGAGNLISGHNNSGVFILGSGATENWVQGNFIGTDVTGTSALGNVNGVFITFDASDNTIGGTASGAGNTIAFNANGVFVISGTGNAILSNSIFSNTAMGFDLELTSQGVTPNDAKDDDTGANNLQNFPVLVSATSGGTTIKGTLNSTPNSKFRLEFFSNSACDGSGHGEGETFLGFTIVTTDDSGNVGFKAAFLSAVSIGDSITATATDPDNNTSEFSLCALVTSE